jgi:Quinohemoprotein amine dehydrogenase, alpha subunit domain III
MPPEITTLARSTVARITALVVGIALLALLAFHFVPLTPSPVTTWQAGSPIAGGPSRTESVAGIMHAQLIADRSEQAPVHPRAEEEGDFRESLPENPSSPAVSQLPGDAASRSATLSTPQTLGTNFTGAALSDTPGFVPPDTMGAVGPTQYVATVNGRFRSFGKANGLADGALNVDPNVFFGSVRSDNTSDPRIRYDRLTGRWFITMIDVSSTNNRILLAVSSASVITSTASFTFFEIPSDSTAPTRSTSDFADYDTLGIDAKALYIGTNVFSNTGAFKGTDGYVIRKSSVLGTGPIVVTVFRNLAIGTGEGPFTPQGVDNVDPNATEGAFIGVSNAFFGELVLRRVADPGGTPSISSNILITVPTTSFPLAAPQTGSAKTLDALDDRLFAATFRDGELWTAHNIGVNSTGVASSPTRTAVRWYELTGIRSGQTPSVVQTGTIFDGAASNPRFFLIPSVMVSGQGHAAFGFSTSGGTEHPNAATVGRLVGGALGTVGAPQLYTNSTSTYGPQATSTIQRWGDYSYTSLDPVDDMTMWTVQEFSNGTNSWAVRVVKLIPPPPSTPALVSPATVTAGQSSVSITVTGTQAAGSGFYDPGANLGGAAVPFSHIGASVTGGVTVNSVTVNSPTQITLNVSTVGATSGAQSISVTNPDGQTRTGTGILTVSGDAGAPTVSSVDPKALGQGGTRNLTVSGAAFQAGATATVSGTGVTVVSTTFVDSTMLKVKVKATATAPTGTRDMTVTSGSSSATCTACLTIHPAPAPTSTSPNRGARGATLSVDILGSNFRSGAIAKFGSGVTVNSTTFINSGKLTASITIASGTTTGARSVKVVNPDKGTGSCVGCFSLT